MAKVLADEQINQLREIFSQFDMDSDGSLTYLELAALLRSMGLQLSGDQIYTMFNNMDSNGNGTVEFEEFVNAMSIDHVKTEKILINQREIVEAFRSFDPDGHGFITPAQLAKSMAKMGQPLTYHELTAMVEEADVDGDGVINFKEFSTIMAKSAANISGTQT